MSSIEAMLAFAVAAILAIALARPVKALWDRFEARNQAQRHEFTRDMLTPNAHFKHTLRVIAEKTEAVQVVNRVSAEADAIERVAVFRGQAFASVAEAEEARAQAILGEARAYYQDVDRLRLGRG